MEDIEPTLIQQNAGPGNEAGSGEWPAPGEEPTGPAPGTDPAVRERMERAREEATGSKNAAPPPQDEVPAEDAATRTQLDPESPEPAPEG